MEKKLHHYYLHLTYAIVIFLLTAATIPIIVYAQYNFVLNGTATSIGNDCWRLTQASASQNGSAWEDTQIDLNDPFDETFDVYLGNSDGGADGINFIFQNGTTAAMGINGGGMGYKNLSPCTASIAVELDTWQNSGGDFNDPFQDHIALVSMQSNNHNAATNLAGPVTLANLENGQDHLLRIVWDPVNQNFKAYLDCVLRIDHDIDLINIFNGNPMVWWGFAGSTGAAFNLQRFCIHEPLDPQSTLADEVDICEGESVQLTGVSGGDSYSWTPIGSGLNSYVIAEPTATPDDTTQYIVKVKDECNVVILEDTIVVNVIHPVYPFGDDITLCQGQDTLLDATSLNVDSYTWQDGSTGPTFTASTDGIYWVDMTIADCTFRDSIELFIEIPPDVDLGPDIEECTGITITLDATTTDALTYTWSDNSGNPTLDVTDSGIYWVDVDFGLCVVRDSIDVLFTSLDAINLGDDMTLCEGNTLMLDGTVTGATDYIWQDGSTGPTYEVSMEGLYWVETQVGPCIVRDSIEVMYDAMPVVDLGPDENLCEGDMIMLDAGNPGAVYEWQDASDAMTFEATQSGIYWVDVINGTCTKRDSIELVFEAPPVIDLGKDTTLCEGNSVLLDATTPDATYSWQDGSTEATFTATDNGTYWVDVTVGACTVRDSIEIVFDLLFSFDLGNDTTFCNEGQVITIDATTTNASYQWQDGSTGATFDVTGTGIYWVEVTVGTCVVRDSIEFTYDEPPVLDLGENMTLCSSDFPITLDAYIPDATYDWSTGSTDSAIVVNGEANIFLTLTLGTCEVEDFILIKEIVMPAINIGEDTAICESNTLDLDATTTDATAYSWQDGSTDATFTVTDAGIYWVDVSIDDCVARDSIEVSITPLPVINLGNDTTLCDGEILSLEATTPNATYSWQDGSTDANLDITQSGTYWVDVTVNNCTTRDSIDVIFISATGINLGDDQTLCEGDELILDAMASGATYEWQDGSTDATFTVTNAGLYWVDVIFGNCSARDTIVIDYQAPPDLDLGNDLSICAGENLSLDATTPGATYQWQDGSTGATFDVSSEGQYWVTITLGPCIVSDTINISFDTSLSIDIGEDAEICEGDSFVIDATTPNATYEWQDRSTDLTFTATQSGTYWVEVSIGSCTATDSIDITVKPSPLVNLGNDITLCDGQMLDLDATLSNATYSWQDGSMDATFSVEQAGIYWVDVTVDGCTTRDSIEVIFGSNLDIDLGQDTVLCAGNILTLGVNIPGALYTWQNGSTNSIQNVNQTGEYWVEVDVNGCTDSDTIYVEFVQPPFFDLGPSNVSICEGDSLVFDVTALSPDATYQWFDGDDQPVKVVKDEGYYAVTVTLANCSHSDEIQVSFMDPPAIDLGNDLVLCEGDAITLDATTPNALYTWQDNSNDATFELTQAGTYWVEIDINGCVNSDTIIVDYINPVAEFDISDTELCIGQNTTITYTGSTSQGMTYTWDFGGGTADPGTGEGPHTVSWTNAGPKTVTLNITENNCTAQFTGQIDIITPLTMPLINCTGSTTSSVTFEWNDVTGATGYEITYTLPDGSQTTEAITGTEYTVNGLNVGDDVSISVIALGNPPCGNSEAGTADCTASDCPDITLSISNYDSEYCADAGLVTLITDPPGGILLLDGTDLGGNIFDPSQAGTGLHTITYKYTDPATDCDYSTNIQITVFEVPEANFNIDNVEICTTESATITYTGNANANAIYTWDFGGGSANPGTGQGPHTISWATSGIKQIKLTVEQDGCISETVIKGLDVYEPLVVPVINCSETTTSSVTFEWNDITGATGYEITYTLPDGTQTTETITDTEYTVNGLNVGDEVAISVIALGNPPCGNSEAGTADCTASDCPNIIPSISGFDSEYCENVAPVTLIIDPPGGTLLLNGTDLGGTEFDPAQAGPGQHTITYEYIDPLTNCDYNASVQITVYAVPDAEFTIGDLEICSDGSTEIIYTGVAGPNAIYTWNFDGGNADPGTGQGPHIVSWLNAGIKTVSLTVEENGCISGSVFNTIEVFEPLQTPLVNCIESTTSSVTFEWNDITGATGYEITYTLPDNSQTTETILDNTYTVNGLNVGDDVTISVIALGNPPCGNGEAGTADCTAKDCPDITPSISGFDTDYCVDADPVSLITDPPGGILYINGADLGGDIFDPAQAGTGLHFISYEYTDVATDCDYSTNIQIWVHKIPTADFNIANLEICSDGSTSINYAGDADAGAIYTWDFDGGTANPGTGQGPHDVSWTSAGIKTVTLTVEENGCVSEMANNTIEVFEPLQTPVVNCSGSTTSSVTFEWNAIAGATEYLLSYTLPDGTPVTTNTVNTTYTVNDLNTNDSIIITVIAETDSPCGNSEAGTADCTAQDCPDITLNISGYDAEYCFNDFPVTLVPEPVGGTFQLNGTDMVNPTFDPAQADTGLHTITYFYIDPATDCEYSTNIQIMVYGVPVADFEISDDVLCIDQTTSINYLGTASPSANYIWDFDGGTVEPGTGQGPHDIFWTSPGLKTVGLTVEENGCTSGLFIYNINISEPLNIPVITCADITTSSVTFEWDAVNGAGGYEITYTLPDNSQTTETITETTYTVSGLGVGEDVIISVIVLGNPPCGNSEAGTQTCTTDDCPDITLNISGYANEYCIGDDVASLTLEPSGGILLINGNDVGNYIFDPTQTGVGTHTLTYEYIDPATDCDYSTSIEITVYDLPFVDLGNDVQICEGESITLDASTAGVSYLWSDNSTAATLTVSESGLYSVVIEQNGCMTTDEIQVTVQDLPVFDLGEDLKICEGEEVTLDVTTAGADSYLWNDNSIDPTFTVNETGTYEVTVTSNGCSITDEIEITYEVCVLKVIIPNAFSPNSDGVNDGFRPFINTETQNYVFRIYSRWGQLLFETNDPLAEWQGDFNNTQQEIGVYVYTLSFYTELEEQDRAIKGNVTLMR